MVALSRGGAAPPADEELGRHGGQQQPDLQHGGGADPRHGRAASTWKTDRCVWGVELTHVLKHDKSHNKVILNLWSESKTGFTAPLFRTSRFLKLEQMTQFYFCFIYINAPHAGDTCVFTFFFKLSKYLYYPITADHEGVDGPFASCHVRRRWSAEVMLTACHRQGAVVLITLLWSGLQRLTCKLPVKSMGLCSEILKK